MAHDMRAAIYGHERLLAVARGAFGHTNPITVAVVALGRDVDEKFLEAHRLNDIGFFVEAGESIESGWQDFRTACRLVKGGICTARN